MNPPSPSPLFATLLAALLLPFASRAADESSLLAILQSNAPPVQKAEACKQLRVIGTPQSVPALAPLLRDERLSQAARYALEALPGPEATAALREALTQTSAPLQAGLAHSLGWRRDAQSVPLLIPLLSHSDPALATAAALALGRISTPAAQEALTQARSNVLPTVRLAVVEGILACAEQRLAEGNPTQARALCQPLTANSEPDHLRTAAWTTLLRASEARTFEAIQAALTGPDPAAQLAALPLAGAVNHPLATAALARLLPHAAPSLQVALLGQMQRRADPTALPAVLNAAQNPDPAVRAAALAALGTLGDPSALPTLAEAASQDPPSQTAARLALQTVHRGPIDEALASLLPDAQPAVQKELIRALTARRAVATVPQFLQLARNPTPATRQAALAALAALAEDSHLPALAQLLADAPDDQTRDRALEALGALAGRTADPAQLDLAPILAGLTSPSPATRLAFLQSTSLFKNPSLRQPLRTALQDPNPTLRAGAQRALCDTPDPDLLPDLLDLARTTNDPSLRSLALQGYARLVCPPEDNPFPPSQRAALLQPAFELATRPEDQRRLLSGLAQIPDPLALQLAEKASAQTAVRPEAELATLQIAQAIAPQSPAAEPALQRLASDAASPTTRQEARAALQRLFTGWLASPPYRVDGKEAQALFDLPFPPERPNPTEIPWRRAPGSTDPSRPGELDLLGIAGGNHCVVYAKTRVHIPTEQPVLLSIGSDDGIKLWVNGQLVHANNAVRGLTPGEDRVQTRLRSGWNDFLAKITQHTAGCGLNLRITTPDGQDIPELRLGE